MIRSNQGTWLVTFFPFLLCEKLLLNKHNPIDKQTQMHQCRVNTNHAYLSGLGDDDLRLLATNQRAWSAQRGLYAEVDGEWRLPGVRTEPRPGDNWHGKPLNSQCRSQSFRCKGKSTSFCVESDDNHPGQTTRRSELYNKGQHLSTIIRCDKTLTRIWNWLETKSRPRKKLNSKHQKKFATLLRAKAGNIYHRKLRHSIRAFLCRF